MINRTQFVSTMRLRTAMMASCLVLLFLAGLTSTAAQDRPAPHRGTMGASPGGTLPPLPPRLYSHPTVPRCLRPSRVSSSRFNLRIMYRLC